MGVNGIYGLSGSGLDVESMVKVGMLGKQSEYDKMQQKYTKNEWTKAEFLDLYGELQTFNSSTLSQYKLSSNMNARAASSSNESALTATANASAALMTHHVKVNGLASNVYLVGTEKVSRANTAEATKNQLASILFSEISKDADTGKIYVNGNSGTQYDEDDTAVSFSLDDGITGIVTNSDTDTLIARVDPTAASGTYSIQITSMAQASTIETNILQGNITPSDPLTNILNTWASGNDTLAAALPTYFSQMAATSPNTVAVAFTIGDGTTEKEISYTYSEINAYLDGSKTVQNFIDDINSELSAAGVTVEASISNDGKLSLTNTSSDTGSNSIVTVAVNEDMTRNAMTAQTNNTSTVAYAYATTYGSELEAAVTPVAENATDTASTDASAAAYSYAYSYYSNYYANQLATQAATQVSNGVAAAVGLAYSDASVAYVTEYLNSFDTAAAETAAKAAYNAVINSDDYASIRSYITTYGDSADTAVSKITTAATNNDVAGAAQTAAVNSAITNFSANGDRYDAIAANLVDSLLEIDENNTANVVSAETTASGMYTVTIEGENAKGSVTNPNGTVTSLDSLPASAFSADGNTFSLDGMTYTAKKTTAAGQSVTISNPGTQNIEITYGELADGFSLNELASKINGLGGNVKATYDTVQDRFSIYNKETGSKNQLNLSIASNNAAGSNAEKVVGDNTAKLFNAFALQQSVNGELEGNVLNNLTAGDTKNISGGDGGVTIDGVSYTLESNKTTVNGVMYNFLNTTGINDTITVSVTQDTAGIVDKVKSFVSDYNALLAKLYEWYDEKPNSDYKPLTARQKEEMKEEQIEKWEEKAKAGLLYHDKTLGKIITDLRAAVSEKVDGITSKYNTIFAVGISTTGLKGQLKLDEDKLNAALAEDPDAVYNIFAKLDGGEKQYLVQNSSGQQFWTTNKNQAGVTVVLKNGEEVTKTVERSSYNGVAQRLGDIFMTAMKSVKSVAGSSAEISEDSELNNLMRELQTKMSNFKRMMAAFESKLYKKYDAMESSLALLGAQLNYVTGAFQ